MRHNKKNNHLGRKHSHRSAMLSNMASSLIMHKRIKTTVPKAKALRTYVEPLITKSKVDSTHSRRVVFSYLQNKESVSELFREVAVKVGDRPGGYTRILKLGTRLGDSADMCIIELVDYNENMLKDAKDSKSKSTRRRRSKKKTETPTNATEQQVTEKVDATTNEKPIEQSKAEEKTEAKSEKKTQAKKPVEQSKVEEKAEQSKAKAKPEKKTQAKAVEKTEDKKKTPKVEKSEDKTDEK